MGARMRWRTIQAMMRLRYAIDSVGTDSRLLNQPHLNTDSSMPVRSHVRRVRICRGRPWTRMSRSADGCGDGCEVKQERAWTHLFHFVCGERGRAKQWHAWTPMFCWELFSASYLRPWARLFHLVRSERGQEKIHEVEAKRLDETKAYVHAFISLGAASVKPLRPWTPMFRPACRATGWTARTRQGVFPARESCGKCLPRPRLHQTRNGSWCSRCVGQFVTQSR